MASKARDNNKPTQGFLGEVGLMGLKANQIKLANMRELKNKYEELRKARFK